MVGKDIPKKSYSLEHVLTDNHVDHILQQEFKDANCNYELICSEVKPASEGLSGYLGDHIRAVLHVKVKDSVERVNLFVKRIPVGNKPKAEFIDGHNFFKREKLMLQLLDDMKGAEGPHPWCAKAYVCTDSLVVMPDLAVSGYAVHPLMETLDLPHVLLTVAALARYHAAFANYETQKTLNAKRPYNFYQQYEHLLVDPTFKDSPFVRTAAKLSVDLLDEFSTQYSKKNLPGLEGKLAKLYVEACESLNVAKDSLNVMVHKDLWNNNILFKYCEGNPTNAILIDYQCVRYGPPTFDLTSLLYMTTSKQFREDYERQVFQYYYEVFSDSLEDMTRKYLEVLGYDQRNFLWWCEKSRMFGIFEAIAIFPQVLMDGTTAQKVFDDPDTFMALVEEDRSGPVVEYAKHYPVYRERLLDVTNEFVERYVLGNLN